jgi:hypothetical protein
VSLWWESSISYKIFTHACFQLFVYIHPSRSEFTQPCVVS